MLGKLLEKTRNTLLYGGLDKASYNKYEPMLLEQDMRGLALYLPILGLGFLLIGLVSLSIDQMATANSRIYLLTSVPMLALFLAQRLLLRRGEKTALYQEVLVYLFMVIVYTEAIALTLQHPDKLAVTFVGALLMMPLLFARRPLPIILLQILITALFCVFAQKYKEPEVAFNDVWNGITFLAVSIAGICVVVPTRIRSLAQTQIIKEMSEYDRLTGLKNRNSYEELFTDLSGKGTPTVVIYADANGLHETNNEKGHEEGDILLKTVASCLSMFFGRERTFRIGGDEFVMLCPNGDMEYVRVLIARAQRRIEETGYSVSFGCAETGEAGEKLNLVVKRAESAMYAAKAAYYNTPGKDRRRREN